MTYKEYKQLFDEESDRGLKSAMRAPQKRGWSAMTKQSIESKNDVIRACNTNLSLIASRCAERYSDKPSLLKDEEDEKLIG
jgi:hypothetical protein|tara:strand:- start:41 stop:283 length:243 start_codon:yes stop_codon:yes gene_type:complete